MDTNTKPRIVLEDWPVLPELTRGTRWAKRLERAERMGMFAPIDVRNASSWTSCAIGERYFEGFNGKPQDEAYFNRTGGRHTYGTKQYRLGIEFMAHVAQNRVAEARRVYEEIQKLPK